jgi:chemotaxis-related protein WspD
MSDQDKKIDDCWNRIGVWAKGERSCPKLEKAIHCANCEVFSFAGRELLECEAPEGYLEEWSESLSSDLHKQQHSTTSVLLFRLGDEWVGLDSTLLDEVVSIGPVHSIPHRKSTILKGLISIRGELQLCVSLGRLLNVTKGEITGTNIVKGIYERMIVVSTENAKFVFPVSEVKGVHRFNQSDVMDAPATAVNCSVHFLKGMLNWEDKHVSVLDHELLFPALERGIL